MNKPIEHVLRRRVHYFSGFDPRGAAWYHRMCREQGEKSQPSGGKVNTGARTKGAGHTHWWPVEWREDGPDGTTRQVHTEHMFMGWDDIVRQHWPRNPWQLALTWLGVYWNPLARLTLKHAWGTYPPAFWTGLWPALFVLVAILAALGLGGLVAGLLGYWWPASSTASASQALGAVLATALSLYGLSGLADKAGVFWLMRTYAFNMRMGQHGVANLQQRQQEWVEQIIARQAQDPADEVLLVGHSVGTLAMVEAVDQLLQDKTWQNLQQGKATGMLTLGHCYPFVTLAPQAQSFREALGRLCNHPALLWWDITARIDPLCFYQVHPLAGTLMSADSHAQPVCTAAQFFRMYELAHWSKIKHNKLRAHFLYLMTPDKPGNFHLHNVLYGPRPIAMNIRQAIHDRT